MTPVNGHRVLSSATHAAHPAEGAQATGRSPGTGLDPTFLPEMPRAGWTAVSADPMIGVNAELVDNDLAFRLGFLSQYMDPRRDINDECGFPRDSEFVGADKYQRLYERDSLFARVVECVPKECWQVTPLVYSSEDPTKATPFEKAWDELGKNLRGTFSRYRDEEGSPVWEYLMRADVMSGIGRYGIILLGLDDGKPLHEPVEGVEEKYSVEAGRRDTGLTGPDGKPLYDDLPAAAKVPGVYNITVNAEKTKGRQLRFLRVFPETLAPVVRWESNFTSPRFGQPTAYQITLNDPFSTQQNQGMGFDVATREVHWTRVIHVADLHHAASSSEVMAVPRGQQVLNEVLTSQKPRWASGEGYWKSCIPTMVVSTHPSLGGNVKVNRTEMRNMMENVQNGLQKGIFLMGATATNLAPSVVDPTPFIKACIEAICVKINIPMRIFVGSERGELASSQDEGDWAEERKGRNRVYTIPRIVVPFIDRLVLVGVLPDPGEPHEVLQDETSILSPGAEEGGGATDVDDPVEELGDPDEEQAEREGDEDMVPQEEEDEEDEVPVGNAVPPQFAKGRKPAVGEDDEEDEASVGGGKPVKSSVASGAPGELTPVGAPGELKYKTEGGYVVEWPDIEVQTEKEKAEVALTVAQADAAYIAGDNGQLVAPMDYLVRTRGMDEAEAAAVLENSAARKEELKAEQQQQAEEQMAQQEDALDRGIVPDPNDPDLVAPVQVGGGGPPGAGGIPGAGPGGKGGSPGAGGKKKPPFPPKPSLNKEFVVNAAGEWIEGVWVGNVFCPTGPGGGIDPTCKPGGKAGPRTGKATKRQMKNFARRIARASRKTHSPDVERDRNKDGVTDAARVGVPAHDVPPPPPVGRLPNLKGRAAHVEDVFIRAYEKNPERVAGNFRRMVHATTKPGDPPTFGTDDAKALSSAWNHKDQARRAQNRATLNLPLHQTANAIAKRAFLQEMDGMKAGDEIMVTVGGCGAGKGYALKNVPEALAMKGRSKAVWDSAGDQNATENPWIQREAESRGLKVNYVFVHADPRTQWAHPERGVVKRAGDPNDGRMVDAKVFADSYGLGAKNHQAFFEKHKDSTSASFVFLENSGTPRKIDGIPPEALRYNRRELAKFAAEVVRKSDAPRHVKRGGTMGEKIWAGD